MADNIVESIIVKLGLDGSQYNREADTAIRKNKEVNRSVSETDKTVSTVTKTLGRWFSVMAAATGLIRMIDQVQKLNEELFHLEKNLGMSASTIKSWQGAAGAMGGSAQGMTESIKSLNMGMNDFVVMGDTSLLPFMNALGVSMVDASGKLRDTDKVMLDLADSFSKMDREQAFSIASKMGIDEGTFNTLVQGRKEMEKMLEYQSKMYKSSEEELKTSRQLAQNRALLGQHWESLKTMMANAIIPLFVKLSEVALGIFEYLQENQEAVQAVFKGISFVVGMILIPMLAKATLAALAFMAPFAPFILVVGALGAAFGALYDDYKTWAEGGKSLFDWGLFKRYIDNAKISTESLTNGFKYLITGYTDWSKLAEDGKAWLKMKGFIDENGVSIRSLINGFQNLAAEIMQEVIPTLQGYASIVKQIFEGNFAGAWSEAKEMGQEFWRRTKATGAAIWDRVTGAADIATGQPLGTASGSMPQQYSAPQIGSIPSGSNPILELLNKGETGGKSGAAAYNTAYLGMRIKPSKPISSMTIGEVMAWQKQNLDEQAERGIPAKRRSSAAGRYQILYSSMRGYMAGAGLGMGDTFSAENQDKMAMAMLRGGTYGLDNVRAGKATPDQFIDKILSNQWASVQNSRGIGVYDKPGFNKASITPLQSRAAIAAYLGMSTQQSPIQQAMRQGDYIDLSRVQANQPKANAANQVQVNVGDIKIQTSSPTVTGNVQDAMGAVQNQFYQLQPSFK